MCGARIRRVSVGWSLDLLGGRSILSSVARARVNGGRVGDASVTDLEYNEHQDCIGS
jgi:hypothetical protein